MKPLLIAAVLLLVPAAASAQVAAGSVPNTFDPPAGGAAAAPARAAPPRAAATPAQPANAASEETLRTIIAGAQAGAIDYSLMTDDLASKVREQEATVMPLIQGFGAVQAVDFIGPQDGADLFVVAFAKAETQWVIGFNEAGKVAALLFRPAPEPGAAPAAQ
jgi:hypothetical protein